MVRPGGEGCQLRSGYREEESHTSRILEYVSAIPPPRFRFLMGTRKEGRMFGFGASEVDGGGEK